MIAANYPFSVGGSEIRQEFGQVLLGSSLKMQYM
jgi:hypothetical protein